MEPRARAGELVAGKYRLVERIARGGMGEVWLAEHDGLGTELALKLPALGPGDASHALSRFRFEAQVSARLAASTPHVVAVHDAGEHDGVPFMAMEYVRGHGLDEELERDGAIDPARLADVLDQVADALRAAHAHGIVHRDLKPSNILIGERAGGPLVVKLCDFGVAKATRAELRLDRPKETSKGRLVGSPAYMSPEQIRGAPLDARSDVWSLGVVAYEALTGFQPFSGETMADLVAAIAGREPDPPSAIRAALDGRVDAWVARALAKDPDDRFASVEEMAVAFRATLERAGFALPAWARWSLVAAALACAGSIGALAVVRARGATHASYAASRSSPPPADAPRPAGTIETAAAALADEEPRPAATSAARADTGSPSRAPVRTTRTRPDPAAARADVPATGPARKPIDPSEIQ